MFKKLMIKMWVEIQLFSLRRQLKKAYRIYLKNGNRLKHVQELIEYEIKHTKA